MPAYRRCLRADHSFCASLGQATQWEPLLSSPWFGTSLCKPILRSMLFSGGMFFFTGAGISETRCCEHSRASKSARVSQATVSFQNIGTLKVIPTPNFRISPGGRKHRTTAKIYIYIYIYVYMERGREREREREIHLRSQGNEEKPGGRISKIHEEWAHMYIYIYIY